MKEWIRQICTFSYTEQKGIFVLGLIMVAVGFYKNILPDSPPEQVKITVEMYNQIAKFEKETSRFPNKSRLDNVAFVGTTEPFDPNILDKEGWMQMGFSEKEASSIRKFVEKGGKFRKAEDLKKLYCMSPERYNALLPFVSVGEKNNSRPKREIGKQSGKKIIIELNTADSVDLLKLPGVGAYRASMILKWRNRLGGFWSTEQLHEMRSLPDTLVQKIKSLCTADSNYLKRFPINQATLEELQNHPYFWKGVGKSIVNYRSKHGPYRSAADLSKIYSLTDEQRGKVIHYLHFE